MNFPLRHLFQPLIPFVVATRKRPTIQRHATRFKKGKRKKKKKRKILSNDAEVTRSDWTRFFPRERVRLQNLNLMTSSVQGRLFVKADVTIRCGNKKVIKFNVIYQCQYWNESRMPNARILKREGTNLSLFRFTPITLDTIWHGRPNWKWRRTNGCLSANYRHRKLERNCYCCLDRGKRGEGRGLCRK